MGAAKRDIVTFKVDGALLRAMEGVPNRSEFIREALLAALEGTCPLCRGTGTLTLNQRRHWDAFAADHALRRCTQCAEMHLICPQRPAARVHPPTRARRKRRPAARPHRSAP